jgi:UDP-galactopyranose mutase
MKMLFPEGYSKRLEEKLIKLFGYDKKIPILELKKVEDTDLQNLADYIYEKVFVGYTQKQWGMKPEAIDPQVTARVPVNISLDDRYFQDVYQGIPKYGYTHIFENLLKHPNIKVLLKTHAKEILRIDEVKKKIILCNQDFNGVIIYTGPLDELFDYCYGPLPYRSLDFQWKTFEQGLCQPAAVINYPSNYDYTRTTEYKHFTSQQSKQTAISFEYPKHCHTGQDIPYYPILNNENIAIYNKYKELADTYKNLVCLGRLAEFKYYDMDDIVKTVVDNFGEGLSE